MYVQNEKAIGCIQEYEIDQKKADNKIMTVTEQIGDDYKKWKENDAIFISAPTGSGKTTFVLNQLLPWAISRGQKILYLVNRKILKMQLDADICGVESKLRRGGALDQNIKDNLIVVTYQRFEQICQSVVSSPATYQRLLNIYNSCSYIVMDEAHYFMSDSLFNPSTELSFVNLLFHNKLKAFPIHCGYTMIFMSATMENIEQYCANNLKRMCMERNTFVKPHTYTLDIKNKYMGLNIHLFKTYQDLQDMILMQKSKKWMVFVDDKKKGSALDKALKKKQIKSIFIDAQYRHDPEAHKEVDRFVEQRKGSYKVCILTYVLDCGVSVVEDRNNIVIFADNKIEFLQCLGRIRTESYENVHLYIPIGEHNSFSKKLKKVNKALQFFDNDFGVVATFNKKVPQQMQCKLIEMMLKSNQVYKTVKSVCYIDDALNVVKSDLSIAQLDYLKALYEKLDAELEKDKWAFVRIQLSWLNREDETNKIVNEYLEDHYKECRNIIESYLCQFPKEGVSKEEAIEGFNLIRTALFDLIENDDGDLFLGKARGKDITIESARSRLYKKAKAKEGQIYGAEMFNGLMKHLGIPYKMKKKYGGTVYIYRDDD